MQVPVEHTSPEAQACAHSPQLDGSFARFLHVPEQAVYPSGQSGVHEPSRHTEPGGQVMPQEPQL